MAGAEDGRKHGGGGGGGDRKRRRAKYLPHNQKKAVLNHGQQGFLVTCVGGKERSSIQEIINVLEEFMERPKSCSLTSTPVSLGVRIEEGKNDQATNQEVGTDRQPEADSVPKVPATTLDDLERSEDDESDESDIEGARKMLKLPNTVASTYVREDSGRSGGIDELLAAEIDELRNKKKAQFVGSETGCHGVVFIRMHKDEIKSPGSRSTMELAEAIVRDAATSKKSRTRYSMRLLPIEVTCYASAQELEKAVGPVIARHFPVGEGCPPFKFAVSIEARANTSLDKMELINAVAKIVPKPHFVDLKNPDRTILLQIVKTTCAIGVVCNFKELAKYNLRQLTQQDTQKSQPTSKETQLEKEATTSTPHEQVVQLEPNQVITIPTVEVNIGQIEDCKVAEPPATSQG